mgnify:FL=1|tara:strand:- start:1120 stop:2040 length:921 start_codon:yes stop_codon:yes gene_type:complete
MKHIYLLAILFTTGSLYAQTTISYPQRAANYDAFFTDGGGNFDDGTDNFGMWANFDAKQSVAFRNFTETGLPGGTASTMEVGDSFTITVSATQAYGVIGLALLSSPTSTTAWADRINNYAVQVNLNGNSGAYDPWEVVSNGGTIDASTIGGSTTYADFKFKFTLDSATTMTVSINDGTEVFNVTLNNQNITGYSVYIADDYNGVTNKDIFWKPTTEYTYATTMSSEIFDSTEALNVYPNPVSNTFTLNQNVERLEIYNITGKLLKTFNGDFRKGNAFDISNLKQSMYLVKAINNLGDVSTIKLIKT